MAARIYWTCSMMEMGNIGYYGAQNGKEAKRRLIELTRGTIRDVKKRIPRPFDPQYSASYDVVVICNATRHYSILNKIFGKPVFKYNGQESKIVHTYMATINKLESNLTIMRKKK